MSGKFSKLQLPEKIKNDSNFGPPGGGPPSGGLFSQGKLNEMLIFNYFSHIEFNEIINNDS